jgi:hypothetical protein
MFKHRVMLLVLLGECCVFGSSVLDTSLDQFIERIVPITDQTQFRLFYNELIYEQQKQKQSNKSSLQTQQREYIQQLQELGKNSLEVRDPELAAQLKTYLTSSRKLAHAEQRKHGTFLFRYGAYEAFLKNKVNRETSMLVKARSYVRDFSNKVVHWFGGFRKSKVS